ncbi:MAG: type II secretion system F family protein, partial [Acidobacteria bacterium]|nr:type II secretion system F family protein [Acidobacteriota bacterium]
MPEYICRFVNERGQILQQVEQAVSEAELRDRLSQQGFYIYSVRPKAYLGVLRKPAGAKKKVKLAEFLIFNQQFVTLVRAGLPILKALELLSGHIGQPSLRRSINEIRENVKGGALLSEAFRAQGIFPEIYTTSLLAGEKSGNLEEVLNRYISYQRTALSIKKKLAASLVYPALLVTMVMILVTFLVTYVIPNFAELYRTLSEELPPITQALIAFTDAFRESWIILIVLLAGAGIGVWFWHQTDRGGQTLDRLKAKLPLVGEIWTKYQVAQFCRILSTLLAGGIPMVQALETARQSLTSPLLRHTLEVATRQVREGQTLWQGLSQTGFFPGMAIEMVEVGESSGALSPMLASV